MGSVLLDEKDRLVGYGFHQSFGSHHAEVNAIEMAKLQRKDLSGCKIYITLQPCTHQGKTPPCADRIKKENIKETYYLLDDPNPLIENNNEFTKASHHQADNYQDLIAPFLFTLKNEERPFVAIKTAVSKDCLLYTSPSPRDS